MGCVREAHQTKAALCLAFGYSQNEYHCAEYQRAVLGGLQVNHVQTVNGTITLIALCYTMNILFILKKNGDFAAAECCHLHD